MAQIDAIGASLYTRLHYTTSESTDTSPETEAEWLAVIPLDNSTVTQVTHVRDFPAFGTPSNIVNVPVYGQAQSSQIQAQADAPTLEFTLNYVPEDHSALQALAGDNVTRGIRIRLVNAAGIGEVPGASDEHSDFYVLGQVAAFNVTPSLSDTTQATLTIATQGDVYGPFTTSS